MKEMRKPKPLQEGERRDRKRPPFRARLFAVLLLFALIPTIVVTLLFAGAADQALSMLSAGTAWERVARSGESMFSALQDAPLTPAQRATVRSHEQEVRNSVELGKRFGFVAPRTIRLVIAGGLVIVIAVAAGASRVAGHLSRQLSRPVDELVGWTGLIRAGERLPDEGNRRGAPEFEVLRTGMRTMAAELEAGRQRALEAERAAAFRESARRFAHELKNPLTPIRFAVARLRRDVPPELTESVDVLAEEAARLESMARSFAQFGRLPDGPVAQVDLGDLVARAARATVPDRMTLALEIPPALPLITGLHEPLVRAVSNVLLNAVEACGGSGTINVSVSPTTLEGRDAIAVAVRDTGPGIPADKLTHIFEPYMTTKAGGTGLGLAIARQTIDVHHGSIEAFSNPGAGTEIRLVLPVSMQGDAA